MTGRATLWAMTTYFGAILAAAAAALRFDWGLKDFGTALMALAAVPTTLFLVRYLRTRWWARIEGRHMVGMAAVIDLILIEQVVINLLPGRQAWHHSFMAVILVAVGLLMWQRYLMLIAAQAEVRREREATRRAAQVREILADDERRSR